MKKKEKEEALRAAVVGVLKEIYDPELPVDIYALKLIYAIDVDAKKGKVKVTMTLTTPACPVADSLPAEVKYKIAQLPEVKEVEVELTFDPPYDINRLDEETKLTLGIW
ncbi:MAG: iron-sulfur cluster assembly protein [Bacteroidota bacterium]